MDLKAMSKEQLIGMLDDFAKNWLAHDGLWFQQVEKNYGLEKAIELDAEAWRIFTRIEAKRIIVRHNIPEDSGLEGLKKALFLRLYSRLNIQSISEESESSFVFTMNRCRVQYARSQKGLPDFPCKSVGIIEYREFAKTIDPRIKTTCIACPPDLHPKEFYCSWKFEI